jgi:hypothetical protein
MQRLAIGSYGKYVPRMAREPTPMADDYAAVVARGHAWVAEHGDQLVMQPTEGHLLLENIAVAPSARMPLSFGAPLRNRTVDLLLTMDSQASADQQ